jgi:hypothetical protein
MGSVLLLFSILSSITYLWYPGGYKLLPSGSYGGVVALTLFLIGAYSVRIRTIRQLCFDPLAAGIGLVLVFITDWLCRGYGFMQGPSIRGELVLCGLGAYVLLTTKSIHKLWGGFALIAILGCLYCFFSEANGQLLFSDDHGTFQYRLMLLKENFPFVPFYNPQWNAGLDARDTFATGVLNLFFMSFPLVYLFKVELWYSAFIAGLLFVLFPLLTAYAARVAGHRKEVGWIAALLVLCSGLHWYRWGLKYGTMGFVCSAVLMPLALATSARVVEPGQTRKTHTALAILSLFLCLCWPFFGVVLLPLFTVFVVTFVKSCREQLAGDSYRFIRLLITGCLLVALQAPILIVFLGTSNIGTFIGHKESVSVTAEDTGEIRSKQQHASTERRFRHRSGGIELKKTFSALRTIAFSSNPALLFFGLGGLFFLRGWFRILSILQISWFFLLGGVLYPLKPQLELDRLLVLILLLLAIPAAEAIYQFTVRAVSERSRLLKLLCAFSLGFVFTGPMVVWGIVKNRSVEQYYFADEMVTDFKDFLIDYEPEGRLLFSGCILHEFGGGHLAPLTEQTGKLMVASSQAHTLWWYKDVIPPEFGKRGEDGKNEFFDLYNVSDIFAHERKWKKYFKKRPEEFEKVWSGHGFDLFRRKNFKSSYTVAGEAEILDQRADGVLLRPRSDSVKLKFRYNRALVADGCTVHPYRVYEGRNFVELRDCTVGQTVFLRALHPWKQLFLEGRKSIQ